MLGHPYVRVWAARCLRAAETGRGLARRRDRRAGITWELATSLGHLGAIAAVSRGPGRDGGGSHGPGHGCRRASADAGPARARCQAGGPAGRGRVPRRATVSVIRNAVIIRVGDAAGRSAWTGCSPGSRCAVPVPGPPATGEWQPVRMLRAPGLRVALEDTDPFRDCHQWQAAPRLTRRRVRPVAAALRWRHGRKSSASTVLMPRRLRAGLTTLMPLAAARDGRDSARRPRHAFGAVAVARPADPRDPGLAAHPRVPAREAGCGARSLRSLRPGRRPALPCPVAGGQAAARELLQGTYAHLAVTDSGARASTSRPERPPGWPASDSRSRRAHTRDAIETLSSSGSLTPLGTSFVEEMRRSVSA